MRTTRTKHRAAQIAAAVVERKRVDMASIEAYRKKQEEATAALNEAPRVKQAAERALPSQQRLGVQLCKSVGATGVDTVKALAKMLQPPEWIDKMRSGLRQATAPNTTADVAIAERVIEADEQELPHFNER